MDKEALYSCTTPSMWVCMINGRFLVSKGHTAWKRKSDAVKTFMHSKYWEDIVEKLQNDNPDQVEETSYHRWWKYGGTGIKLEQEAYNKLIENQIVKYIEIIPVPDWVNL